MWQAGGMILLRTGSKSCWVPPSLKGGMRIKRDRTNVSTNEANLRFSSEEEWLAVKYSMFKYTWRHWAFLTQLFWYFVGILLNRWDSLSVISVVLNNTKPGAILEDTDFFFHAKSHVCSRLVNYQSGVWLKVNDSTWCLFFFSPL